MDRRSQAERSAQREEDLLKQQQAIAESRKAARHKKPEVSVEDEKELASLKLRKIIFKILLAFLVLGIIYAIFDAMRGGGSKPKKPPVEEAEPANP